jgi:branched-chain amino acid transport system substrate-binding protein
VLGGCACALAAAVGGCTAPAGSTVTVSGSSLTIYASAPVHSAGALGQDVLDAEKLALQQNGPQAGRYQVTLKTLPGDTTAEVTDAARTAIQDSTTIAYLGEIVPHTSYASLGITNALDVLQVSPTDTALELTQRSAAVPGAPDSYYESLKTYNRTFARVVPSTALEAKAQVLQMKALHVKRLYVADDGSPYGRAIAAAVRTDAPPAIAVVGSAAGADGAFDGASSAAAAAQLFDQLASARPTIKLFAPSALAHQAFASRLSGQARNVYVSTPGFLSKNLNAAGRKFVADFKAAYGHSPATEAIFGYEAMASVLSVLRDAGSAANNRTTVIHDFFAIKNRSSVLGTYSIDSGGDTDIAAFVFNRLGRGTLVPYRFVNAAG